MTAKRRNVQPSARHKKPVANVRKTDRPAAALEYVAGNRPGFCMRKREEQGLKKRLKMLLLIGVFAVWGLTGCGKQEAVHTTTEPVVEEQETSAVGETEQNPDRTSASVAQAEIDEETKNELTVELLQENELDTSVLENTRTTKGCSFSLPEDFVESEDLKGMYVTNRYPIDASTIYYVELEQDISLQLMTQDTFTEQMEQQFVDTYGEEIDLQVDSFEKIKIDGYPGFRILCHYSVGDVNISQLEYVINADKSYVITYSQTGEYDRMEEYEASADTIRLEF